MFKTRLSIATAALCFSSFFASAQITGVQTIPGSYPTIEAAITALNSAGVGTGGATFNVAAGYTETPTTSLVLTMAVNGPTLANPLVIQKSGVGANPLITAPTTGASTTLDGLFILNGVDYVTINGINLQENIANVTTTTQMEFGYALLKSAANNGANNNTIKNCSVTLAQANTASCGIYLANHTTASVTTLTINTISGTSSNNKFYNNAIASCYTGYTINGSTSAAPYDYYDQNNEIGVDGVSTRRSSVTSFGGAVTTASGITATNQNGIKIFKTYINNSGGPAHLGTLNGINLVTGLNSNVDIYNDTLTLTNASVSGSTMIAVNNTMGGTGAGNTVNIYNNVVDGCTYATNTSGTFRGIASTATASYTNMYNNKVTNNSIPGTGELSCIYYGGSSVNIVLNVNINDNVVSGNTKTGTAGAFYMIFASASTVVTNCFNNQLFNNSAAATSAGVYGYYNFAFGLNENVYNNTIYNNTGGSGDVAMLHVRSGSAPTNKEVYGNTIYNITCNTAATFAAIWEDYGTISNIYRNNIYNLTNNSATGNVVGGVVGIYVGSNTNVFTNVYNNFVSDLKAPSMSNATAIAGIFLSSPANATCNAYYNTVYLNATSSGINFGTVAMNCGAGPASIDLRNNILVNVSTPNGTGLTRALGRSSSLLTNYALTSGYNCLYAGTPSANNLLFWDGTNSIQTIFALRNLVTPREQSSFTTLPPFVNIAVAPYDLHLQNSIATQCEGGGTVVAGFTTDYDGTTRNVTTPDVGADEITGLTTDIAGPNIQYTPLTNAAVAATRVLTAFATVTDPSGINTTIGTRPRIYYKRSTNANTLNTNTNATDGWKFVEATNTSSPFNFTVDYSLLFGGGVVAGDVIQYMVVAQDLNGTPIVGWNSGGLTAAPTSVNLLLASFPINTPINQYTIVNAALSGTINVGPTELVTSLTNAGGIFQAINASSLSGNLIINITGDLTAETGTFALNQWAEEGLGGYTVSIVPSAATTRNITGSSAAALIRFDGADRVTVDGRFGGVGTYLRFLNTSNTAPTISLINDAQNNTIRNSIIESGNTSTSTTLGGAILIGNTTGPSGNDNNTITFCDIRDRSDLVGNPAIGINCVGTNSTLAQYNNNCSFVNNTIHDWYLQNSGSQFAIQIGTGNSGFTITGNSFYQTATRTHTVSGAVTRAINISFTAPVNTNGGHTISNNFIGGTAPACTGGDMTLTVSGVGVSHTFAAISVITGLIPNSIQGNVIRKIDFTTNTPTGATSVWLGFNLGQGVHNVGNTTGNIIGDGTTTGSLKITINAGGAVNSFLAGILCATTNGSYNVQNNTIAGITIAGSTTTGGIIPQWIQIQGTPSAATVITGNVIGSVTVPNSIQNNATAPAVISFAIRHLITTGAPATITANTIQNITDNSTNAGSVNYGILIIGTNGPQATVNLSNNIIKDMAISSAPATPVLGNLGISFQGYAGLTHIISGNTISGVNATNTGAFSNYCIGIQTQGNSMGGTMSKNNIFGLANANTASPGIAGIYFSAGLNWTVSNNMISLTNPALTNSVDVTGISDVMGAGAIANYYYNSIYIGGATAAGTTNTFAYVRYSTANATLKDNLLYNKRSGGTGTHGAIGNVSATPTVGWSASNYNAFIVGDTTKIGVWNATVCNMSAWRSNSGGDATSIWETSGTVASNTLWVAPNAGNLHINTSTYPEALGTPIAGITVDYDNNARSATTPTIGADELACSVIVTSLSTQTNISCNGGNNGSATVAGSGGNGITYSWAPTGGNAATATGLTAGTYTCTVSNICGNVGTITVTITQPAVLAATSSQTSVSCNGGANGTATAVPTGGTAPYTYLWSNAGTTATISGLAAGTYTCSVTCTNGCTTTTTITVNQPTALVASASSQTNVLCNGGSSGAATVSVTGGTAAYTYAWSPSGGTAATATGLAIGVYTCTVTDANACTTTQTFNITQPSSLTAGTMQTNVLCAGGNNGDAMVMVSGGSPSYTYSWAPSGGTAAMASGLTAGTYTCTITDANGCQLTQTFTITAPSTMTVSTGQGNPTCNAGNDGSATVTVSGGAGSYTYSWSPSGGTAASASGLTAGTYTCTITDANLCTATQTFNLTEPAAITATTSQNDVSCFGGSNGDAMVTAAGGTGSYTYLWSPSGGTAAMASGLTAGVYTCTITDANSCVGTQTFTIGEPSLLVASTTTSTNPSTCGGTDGSVDITVSGGTAGYTFLWNTSATSEDISGVGAGAYSVTATDANGCTATANANLSDPNAPVVTLAIAIDTVCQTTTAPFTLTGESPAGGTFSGPGVTAGTFDPMTANLGMNIISYTFTDTAGCTGSTTDSIFVDVCTAIGVIPTSDNFTVYPNPNNGTFTLVLNTTEASEVVIYDGLGQLLSTQNVQPGVQQTITLISSGAYMISVTTTDGQRTSKRIIVTK